MYKRIVFESVLKWLNKKQIVILYGSRQVGKTTLTNQIVDYYKENENYNDNEILQISGDNLNTKLAFSKEELKPLKDFIGNSKLLIIDEAQRIQNIGLILKIIYDNIPALKIIATGSSSFDLANKINEPLTGRNIKITLSPFSFEELTQKTRVWDLKQNLEDLLIFGSYPKIILTEHKQDKIELLRNLSGDYLYKDVLEWENLQKPELLNQILQYLSLQIGQTISYNNIANNLNTNPRTIQRYIDLLEKSFVIFKLKAFSRNRNNELVKSSKIYFWDLGIRNTLIDKYNPISQREDIGQLWENFCVLERIKFKNNHFKYGSSYFWRNLNGNEIDYIEDYDGILHAYELKFNKSKIMKGSYNFEKEYKNSTLKLINRNNIEEFLLEN